ncbi:MAG: excinuclease ABC subunit UvrC, partial [Ferruginibacter sp.]|nr:excinuclease ABC subunit UvrC [Ferruginibacter sp.]
MTKEAFHKVSGTIPLSPGIYKYFNENNKLIYVGKAKSLKKRISGYFNKTIDSKKTLELVSKINRIEFTIVDSEEDALLLESTLIKTYQPHYNINLKDDKSYPYIVIKNERFPRVFISRKKINDGSLYFGPYATGGKAYDIMDFIKEHIPLRNCTFHLSQQNIDRKKFRLCLEYHLGNCKGPCEGVQSEEDYSAGIYQIKNLLKGNLSPIISHYKQLIQQHSERLEFEMADTYQQKIKSLQQYQVKSAVVNTRTGNVDVFTILEEGEKAFVNYLSVSNGNITATTTSTLEKKLDETQKEVLEFAIAQLRNSFNSEAKEIIVPFPIHYPGSNIKITIPKTGDKKKLLDLSQKNVNHYKHELIAGKMLHLEEKSEEEKKLILMQMQKDLMLKQLPLHIECFDNSNLHGTHAVAAMVCFKNGEPSKKDYRHYNIKTVEGINDFASMKEVVFRRYRKLKEDQLPLPQLIIIDGGKGQLNAALESIAELQLTGQL